MTELPAMVLDFSYVNFVRIHVLGNSHIELHVLNCRDDAI